MLRALLLCTALLPPAAAAAQDVVAATEETTGQTPIETRADQVVDLLNGKAQPEEIFSDGFRAAIADAQIKALSASLTAQFGPALFAELREPHDGTRSALQVTFERGIAKGGIAIDPAQSNRINELRFTSVEALTLDDDAPEKISADLTALPGSVNAWFAPLEGGTPVISMGPDKSLALGSTFKLYVLAALAEDVKAERRKWADVAALTEKSYPSGLMQDWPEGAPVSLHTLASMMISISDNTATDQLIKVLGKERILKLMKDSGHSDPGANDPFLTTRELFILKAENEAAITAWRSGDRGAREALQGAFAGITNPPVEDINAAFSHGPKALDIEWFASPADLALLFTHMRKTADPAVFDIMAINPSATPAIRERWAYIGYKGGSEPGVLNYTWLLTDKAGRDHVLTLGWNNPDAVLDEGKLLAIAQRILLLPR